MMNKRELAFCAHYAVERNATRAAEAAGYKKAREMGLRILKRPHVIEQLNWITEQRNQLVVLDAATVVNELGAVALTRPDEFMKEVDGVYVFKRPDELNERQRACVRDIKTRMVRTGEHDEEGNEIRVQEFSYVFHDKMSALHKLGDHFGLGEDPSKRSQGNPFEDMEQDELEALQTVMERAMNRKTPAIEGEVVDV